MTVTGGDININELHNRLVHPSRFITCRTAKVAGIKVDGKLAACTACELAKSK